MKYAILDLFCGAGGMARGYADAGFDVVGVDIADQPNYPYEFLQGDAMNLGGRFLSDFDAIHASPPCQAYSMLTRKYGAKYGAPRLIAGVRRILRSTGLPYVMENVTGAPLKDPVLLCGMMFDGLRVIRHRLFETNFPIIQPTHASHTDHPVCHTMDRRKRHFGNTNQWADYVQVTGGGNCSLAAAKNAMGIDWMKKTEINEAIPPAYGRYVGLELMAYIRR